VIAVPETKYVDVGDAQVAYQVVGDGGFDVLFGWGIGSQIELQWAHPAWAGVLERFATFSRLILFDRRGTGASDRLPRDSLPTWEEWAEDMGAVLDAAGSERAAIVAFRDNGPMAIMFTAMHPERVRALVLVGTAARLVAGPDYPIGLPPEAIEATVEFVEKSWATPKDLLRTALPELADDPEFLRWWITMNHASITPRAAGALYRHIFASDVREALSLISVPTLVVHPTDNVIVPLEHAQYLAEGIQGARLIELPGPALGINPLDLEPFFDPVTEFLTGERPMVEVDRVLSTILFTDIVGSTERAVSQGDRRWSAMLEDHNRIVRGELSRFRGREVDTAGDGFVATFDGPARAIRCACAIRDGVQTLGLQIRAGLHTGEVELAGDDIRGVAVHVGARVGAMANPNEVLVSHTVKDLVAGSGIAFNERGEHELKGVPGTWKLYAVGD
jgi:class 3 adenylate cyclase/pimeloyl-ACP methyl ester carboxylesterase